jgi:ABC-type amino acid transport substrate-binding protein
MGGLDSSGLFLILSAVASVALIACAIVALAETRRLAPKRARRAARVALAALLIVGVPLAGLQLLGAALRGAASYTTVEGPTIRKDLVVREWSFLLAGGAQLFERDGTVLTLIATMGIDDGALPFRQGNYTAVEVDGVITLEWEFAPGVWSTLVIGDAALPPSTHDGLYHDFAQDVR